MPATCTGDDGDFPCTPADLLPLYPGADRTAMVGENEAEATPDHVFVVYDLVEDYVPPSG